MTRTHATLTLTTLAALGLAAALPQAARAQDNYYPDDATINTKITGDVEIGLSDRAQFSHPTVTITDGADITGGVYPYSGGGTTHVTMNGGMVEGRYYGQQATQMTLSGGQIGGFFYTNSSAPTTITGGSIGGDFFSQSSAPVAISGGSIAGGLGTQGKSLTISGGTVGKANGSIGLGGVPSYVNYSVQGGVFTLVGTDLTATPLGGRTQTIGSVASGSVQTFTFTDYALSGHLSDGTDLDPSPAGQYVLETEAFSSSFIDPSGHTYTNSSAPTVNGVTFLAPEPPAFAGFTLGALGLAGLGWKARKRAA